MNEHINKVRELTRSERSAIRKLVINMCANYDREYGCLPLDSVCHMLDKLLADTYCKYFQSAVLPLEAGLEASLLDGTVETRPCAFCGEDFPVHGKKAYCGPVCVRKAQRKQQREHMRKKRG